MPAPVNSNVISTMKVAPKVCPNCGSELKWIDVTYSVSEKIFTPIHLLDTYKCTQCGKFVSIEEKMADDQWRDITKR
jgi:DNA-directed RNA polymerase subunit RPC12/RpoP